MIYVLLFTTCFVYWLLIKDMLRAFVSCQFLSCIIYEHIYTKLASIIYVNKVGSM